MASNALPSPTLSLESVLYTAATAFLHRTAQTSLSLSSFERSARRALRPPPSLTCGQTHLPEGLPLCTPLPSLALRKVQPSLLRDVCICCSLSLEHPSTKICLVCFFTLFTLLLPVTAPTICYKLPTSATLPCPFYPIPPGSLGTFHHLIDFIHTHVLDLFSPTGLKAL